MKNLLVKVGRQTPTEGDHKGQYSSNKKKVRKDCKEEAFLTDSE
jgi:hypothetical protein